MDAAPVPFVVNANWRDTVTYSPGGPDPQILSENENHKVILAGLEAGSQIPTHPEGLAIYYILDGTGWMTVSGQRFAIKAGATIVTPEGAVRGVEAETRLAFLAVRVTT